MREPTRGACLPTAEAAERAGQRLGAQGHRRCQTEGGAGEERRLSAGTAESRCAEGHG